MSTRQDCPIGKTGKKRKATRYTVGGFTLVEMMIGSAIFIIVILAVLKLLEASRDSRFTTTERSEMLRTARVALNTMGHDIVNAGVSYPNSGAMVPNGLLATILGQTYIDTDNIHDFMTPIIAGDNVNTVGSNSTDQLSLIFMDNTFNNGNALSISSASVANSWMVINTASGGDNSHCTPGDIFLISGSTSSALGWLTNTSSTDKLKFESTNDPLSINQPSQSNGVLQSVTYPASATRVDWIRYYVNPGGTLFRRVYGSQSTRAGNGVTIDTTLGYLDTPIADNVTNLQIKYTLSDNSVVSSPTFAQYPSIRQVTITISLQSPDVDKRLNARETMSISATFDARNLGYIER